MDSLDQAINIEVRDASGGKRVFGTRDRIPFQGLRLETGIREAAPSGEAVAEKAHHDEEDKYDMEEYQAILQVTASSTGVDHHGTEMTEEALVMMQRQMQGGVVYLPSHGEYEWDDVIGRTIDAQIEDGTIMHDGATGDSGKGRVLRVMVGLYADDKRASRLANIIKRQRHAVGTSIGGWFTDLEFVVNSEDEIERILVKGVELDHLATTRRPSNRESWISGLMERCATALSEMRTPEPAAEPAAEVEERSKPEQRHIWEVVENEDSVTVTFGKSEGEWKGIQSEDSGDSDVGMQDAEPEERAADEDCAVEPSEIRETGSEEEISELDNDTIVSSNQVERTDAGKCAAPSNHELGVQMDKPGIDEKVEELARSQAAMVASIQALTAAMQARVDAEAAATPKEDPMVALQRQNEELRNKLQRTMTAAGRAGVGAVATRRLDTAGGFRGMVARSAPELSDTSAVQMVCEGQAVRRDASRKDTPSRMELEEDLRSLLAAAFADGIITDSSSN